MDSCLFCKIIAGDIPSKTIYENDYVMAFDDIEPQAPVHVLIIPKKHISTINDLDDSDKNLCGEFFWRKIAFWTNDNIYRTKILEFQIVNV